MGKPITMDDIRAMVTETTSDAENMLRDQLGLKEGDDVRFVPRPDRIEDDLTYAQRGKSFIHRNGLDGKELEMLEDLIKGRRKREFLDGAGQWKWDAVRKYIKTVGKWLELVQLLAHITRGQPSYGEEINGLQQCSAEKYTVLHNPEPLIGCSAVLTNYPCYHAKSA